jgi:hypothetical protein
MIVYVNMFGVSFMFINVFHGFAVNAASAVIQAVRDLVFQTVCLPFIGASVLAIAAIMLHQFFPQLLKHLWSSLKTVLGAVHMRSFKDNETLDKALKETGFSYDPQQDMFYSTMNAWQSRFGYCRLYDEACAPMGMIVDCEPVHFEYDGKKWLIELWKGQYDMTTGCEIGVYNTDEPEITIPGVFSDTLYHCANYADQLHMSYILQKKGQTLFTREDRHWWLTGFKLGEFSEPSELVTVINITLKDEMMCSAFVQGLMNIGYAGEEFAVDGKTVIITYKKPHSPQPLTRLPATDWLIQRKNEELCKKYQEIAGPYLKMPDKFKAIYKYSPEMYKEMLDLRKTSKMSEIYQRFSDYISQ